MKPPAEISQVISTMIQSWPPSALGSPRFDVFDLAFRDQRGFGLRGRVRGPGSGRERARRVVLFGHPQTPLGHRASVERGGRRKRGSSRSATRSSALQSEGP
jgi:hypothetical protein